ncbi:hypothetical protein FACS1894122_02650 [Alphaproteobacteria bacterium]|nr:hypothetical protein FACS1894122_02650 [Alphaproteobacteria bacterium]
MKGILLAGLLAFLASNDCCAAPSNQEFINEVTSCAADMCVINYGTIGKYTLLSAQCSTIVRVTMEKHDLSEAQMDVLLNGNGEMSLSEILISKNCEELLNDAIYEKETENYSENLAEIISKSNISAKEAVAQLATRGIFEPVKQVISSRSKSIMDYTRFGRRRTTSPTAVTSNLVMAHPSISYSTMPRSGLEEYLLPPGALFGNVVRVGGGATLIIARKTIGDGSCGYRAIDPKKERANDERHVFADALSRQEQIQELLNHLDDRNVRALIAPEAGSNLPSGITGSAEYRAYLDAERPLTVDKSLFFAEINEFLAVVGLPRADSCPDLEERAHNIPVELRSDFDVLFERCKNKQAEIDNMDREFFRSGKVVGSYLRFIKTNNEDADLQEHTGPDNRPTGVLDAIAYLQGINLCIVAETSFIGIDGAQRNAGKILHEYRHPNPNGRTATKPNGKTVFIIYRPGHFSQAEEIVIGQ